ncbi:MAG: hypothetical protein HYY77_22635 [Betaproteobacteria bacterium]|nr:hypothetical protein [Betaproteobacteria bacterium]
MRSIPLLAALSCLLLIAGCSALRLSYSQADTLLAWRANEYFDLNPLQRDDLNERLERLHAWHRYEQLPDYAAFTSAAIARARHGLKHDDLVWFIEGLKARYRVIINHGSTDAAEMLATLAPEQIDALQKQWRKVNRKFASEYDLDGSVEKRKRARLKKVLDQIQDWTGGLTYEQEQKIAALLDAIPLIEHLRHADRIRRQQEFLQLLKLRTNPREFRPKLQAWLVDWERGRAPEYQQLSVELYAKRIEFYLAVDKLLTPGQRQIALHRLQEYVDDFKALAEKPQRAGP